MQHTSHMTAQAMQEINNLAPDQVADFISTCQRSKVLSPLIKQLNAALLTGREDQRQDARSALKKLGFPDV